MTPEERDLINSLFDRLKNVSPAVKDAEAEQCGGLGGNLGGETAPPEDANVIYPGLGVDWGSNIDPGPGPDPGRVDPGGVSDGGNMAV